MKRSGLSPTRVILVLVLLGGVYKVSTLVTPPPEPPPKTAQETAAAAAAANAASAKTGTKPMTAQDQQKEMMSRMKTQYQESKYLKDKEALSTKLNHHVPLERTDNISSEYFQKTPMGTAGIAKTEETAANAKRITDEVNRIMPRPPTSPVAEPPNTPMSVPAPPGTKAIKPVTVDGSAPGK